MPERIVKIWWDSPDDKQWLNKYNIEMVLDNYCANTNFHVEDYEPEEQIIPKLNILNHG